ncbi:class I SAM-dependent methyltransferase [Pedobacter sp. Du54]|uniref:class I SAM-dependent methyltransferase n=1 Tax=Pedobacter anseongensis TaxID=3133439 RepID=UPI0030A69271
MDRYKETFETWNKVASLYENKFMDLQMYNETYDLICDAITVKHAKILEIGCGPGNITKYLLSKRPDFTIYGVDVAPNMIELARKNNPSAQFMVMDCREIHTITTKFDGIICGFCIPYLAPTDCEKLISNAHQLLNENGFIYISFVEGDYDKSDFQVGSSGHKSYFYFYNLDKLKQYLTENGFHSLKTMEVVYKKSPSEEEIHTILTGIKL